MDKLVVNPWSVQSIYDFSYFCCPECDSKWQFKQDFIDHAFNTHPKSIEIREITDGSLSDIQLPPDITDIEHDAIKTEETDPDSGKKYTLLTY